MAVSTQKSSHQKVLILGGGFGGVKTALELSKDKQFTITLMSNIDDFRYYPKLYRAATGGKRTASSIPLREIFKGKSNVCLVKDSAKTLDRQSKSIKGVSGQVYKYDKLVVALGAVTDFFGVKGLKEYSYGIKTFEEAQRLRDHLHQQLVDEGRPDLNYVVVGGGPTGVELAGALPAYIHHIMRRHGLKDRKLHIDLVESAPRLMQRMPKSYSRAAEKRLRRLGVKLHLGQRVQAETADNIILPGHSIATHTVVWTAGVTNHPFLKKNNFKLTNYGKAIVDFYLQAEPDIYVIGDNADTPYSGLAQTALVDGVFVAANLRRQLNGKLPKSYQPKRPIYVTPVGPRWAAVLWAKTHLYGWIGWVMRGAADFVAFHDLEPLPRASKRWMSLWGHEETCPLCKE